MSQALGKFIDQEIQAGIERYTSGSADLKDDLRAISRDAARIIEKGFRGENTKEEIAHIQAQLANVEAIHSIRARREIERVLKEISKKVTAAIASVAVAMVKEI